jgi:non-specific serine/threonine protein kinase/serine/threonine-protein kinase
METEPERTERVAEIVERALESEGDERRRLIADLCDGDADLQIEVDSLLRFEKKAQVFIEMPAFELAADIIADENGGLSPGEQLGNYKIVLRLGEGRMGEVYLAEDTTLGRPVAIKLLKSGRDAAKIVRRFRQEEQILAGLIHPNIAWLYGAAITAGGIPYLVMEYVEGPRLDHYCRDKALSIQERLALFRKTCAAVAYGHQHLVLHRNIKPANVRVGPDGEPKLLDFGMAGPLDATMSTLAQQTLGAMVISEYASPEQVRGEKVATASDVYSLGVVLYELLTQQWPYGSKSLRPGEVAHAIIAQQPMPPSGALAKRAAETVSFFNGSRFEIGNPKALRGDLDHIILKALRKEPARRYPSVEQLSEDIHRHLVGLPVVAGSNVLAYRSGKFVKRHRVPVMAAALLLLSLIGGIIATVGQARRADQQRQLAEQRYTDLRQLADSLIFEIRDSLKNLPSAQRDIATAHETTGDNQENLSSANLGNNEIAQAGDQKATGIRGLPKDDQATTETQMQIGRGYRAMGDLLAQKGDINGTIDKYRSSLSIFEKVGTAHREDQSVQDELARAYETLGDRLDGSERSEERLKIYQSALSIRQHLLVQRPDDATLQRDAGLDFLKVGAASDAKTPEALENIRRGIDILAALSGQDPNNEAAYRELGSGYSWLGQMLIGGGDAAGALESCRKALDVCERIAGRDPKNAQAEFDLSVAHRDLAEALTANGDSSAALDHAQQALSTLLQLSAADPTNVVYRRSIGLCYEKFGDACALLASTKKQSRGRRIKDWIKARTSYKQGLDVFAALREQGKLTAADSGFAEQFAAKIANCDNRLKSSKR